ncbi:hypothetical protein KI387_019355, partial [Taxus chinensis]
VIKDPSVIPPTSSPSNYNVEEEFEISNFMFEDEGNRGDQIVDQEDTMEEVEYIQQDNME